MNIADSGRRHQLPNRRDVLKELKKEIIADNKFFNSLVDAIFTGTTNCSGDGCREIDQLTPFRTGVVVQSDSGGGKTVLLETLFQIYGANRCCLLYSKSIVNKNRGDTESFLLTLFNDCISTGRQLILVDDIDNLAPSKDRISTVTDNYILSTLICGIDTIIQKHNRESSHRKIFIVATSSSDKRVSTSLLVPHRLGDDSKIIKLPYPSQKQRLNIIHCLLRCEGINITWDFDRDGYGKHSYSTKRNVQQLREGFHESHQYSTEKSGIAESNEIANIFNLSLTLSNRTQGASVSDLILALKACYLSSVISKASPAELTRPSISVDSSSAASSSSSSSSSSSFSYFSSSGAGYTFEERKQLQSGSRSSAAQDVTDAPSTRIQIRASDFVRAINEIRPSVAQKHNMLSMIVDSGSSSGGNNGTVDCLVCVEDLQKRLKDAVLLPYLEQTSTLDNHNYFKSSIQDKTIRDVGHCSGILIHGPSGCGKTSLARWLAQEGKGHFKFLSVACADLVHKVVGESEKKLSHVFSAAREMAPCFLLLDNLEIILGSGVSTGNQGIRSGKRTAHQALDRLLSTLLVEIDGLSSSRTLSKLRRMKADIISKDTETGKNIREAAEEEEEEEEDEESRLKAVIVIATTSDINLIDRSLIRPGRLEEHIAMHLPTASQRSVMLTHFADEMIGVQGSVSNKTHTEEETAFIMAARERLRDYPSAHEMAKLRSPGDIKNYLQEKALQSIRQHSTSDSDIFTLQNTTAVSIKADSIL